METHWSVETMAPINRKKIARMHVHMFYWAVGSILSQYAYTMYWCIFVRVHMNNCVHFCSFLKKFSTITEGVIVILFLCVLKYAVCVDMCIYIVHSSRFMYVHIWFNRVHIVVPKWMTLCSSDVCFWVNSIHSLVPVCTCFCSNGYIPIVRAFTFRSV